jgi:hypothetical protein
MAAMPSRSGMAEVRLESILAWCDALERIRDQARSAGEDFFANLVDTAWEHAILLAMREKRAARNRRARP